MHKSNEALGIGVQLALCNHFDTPTGPTRADSRTDPTIVTSLESWMQTEPLIKNLDIVEYIGLSPEWAVEASNRSPHTFLSRSGRTISVVTFQSKGNSKKACPKVIGQGGRKTINEVLGHLQDSPIEKKDLKRLFIEETATVMEVMTHYMFISDITLFVQMAGTWNHPTWSLELIEREDIEFIDWNRHPFSFTQSLSSWNESCTIRYNNITIGESQVHNDSRRFIKFRFDIPNLLELVKRHKTNNETLGMSCETAICRLHGIDDSEIRHRSDPKLVKELMPIVKKAFESMPKATHHLGSDRPFKGQAKSPVDFQLATGKTLSVKTNGGKSRKACPSKIGQPSFQTFDAHFGNKGWYIPPIDETKFKSLVFEQVNLLIPEYLDHLFDCDFLLWIWKDKSRYNYHILRKDEIEGLKAILTDTDHYSFSRDSPTEWNDSCSLRWEGKTIGEFQVHKSRRPPLKFRFNMDNLIKIAGLDDPIK